MNNLLVDCLLRLAAGVPVGNGVCQIPLAVSGQMTELQLEMIAQAIERKEAPPEDLEPSPREYHREWAKQNKIPDWLEPELWERKNAASSTTESISDNS